MSKGGPKQAADGLLLLLAVIIGITMYGPVLALAFRLSLISSAKIIAPIVLPVVGVIFAIILIKRYWAGW